MINQKGVAPIIILVLLVGGIVVASSSYIFGRHIFAPIPTITPTNITPSVSPTSTPLTTAFPSEGVVSSNTLLAALPRGVLLRDFEKLKNGSKNAYLVIYVEPGYKFDSWGYDSCPGIILGDSLSGVYHLVLIQDNKVVNDVILPYAINDGKGALELSFKNKKMYTLKKGTFPESEQDDIIDVKLLQLEDYTGDGKPYEFLLTTTGGGCGFFDGLVAGYDPAANKAVLYSGWIPRFIPDSKGNASYVFDCGDHGNMTRVEAKYGFDPATKKFKKLSEVKTVC